MRTQNNSFIGVYESNLTSLLTQSLAGIYYQKKMENIKFKVSEMVGSVAAPDKNQFMVIDGLQKLLADEFILFIKMKNAHWNVEGNDFYEKHLFFGSQLNLIEGFIDVLAERIRILGHHPVSTLKSILALTHLSENSNTKNNSIAIIKDLLSDNDSIAIHCKELIINLNDHKMNDFGTNDLITVLLKNHEKMSWNFKSHLK